MRAFLLLYLLFTVGFARAEEQESSPNGASISEETDYGSTQFIQQINGSGAFGADTKQDPPWSWNLSYSYDRSVTSNDGAADIVDATNTFAAGAGWNGTSGWGLNVTLNFSDTAAESLTTHGSVLTLSHLWKSAASGDEFQPSFSFSLLGGKDTYAEYYTGTNLPRSKKAKPTQTAGTVDLQQFLFGFDADWVALEAWEFDFSTKVYPYSHSPNDFQNFLDTPKALSTGIGAFAGTLGGLPNTSFIGDIKWRFAEAFTNDLNVTTSILAVGYTLDTAAKDTIEYRLNSMWKITAGIQYETSLSSTYWLGIFGIGYSF